VPTFDSRGSRGSAGPAFPRDGAAARRERHVRPASYFLVSLLSSVLLVAFFGVGDHGFLQVGKRRVELQKAKEQVSNLASANERLEEEIAALKTDPKAVEKIAREDLGFTRPDEIVLQLPKGWRQRVGPGAVNATKGAPPAPR
jgi:cell division protein FtsB